MDVDVPWSVGQRRGGHVSVEALVVVGISGQARTATRLVDAGKVVRNHCMRGKAEIPASSRLSSCVEASSIAESSKRDDELQVDVELLGR
mgnify:CR=1 FL=1